ncbi:MAG: 16S rRNA (guanine(527)-N(7))-methyltransferase RsmG [Alphaproteobacteria bacterium]
MFHVKQFDKILKNSQQDIEKYIKILLDWQKHVNLISKNTISEIQKRHVLDSAQLWKYIPDSSKTLTDVGSGGGFPGIVLGILNKAANFPLKITLVESDTKKAIFLGEVNRQLKLNLTILTARVEKIENLKTDIMTARAFSELNQIFMLCKKIVSRETIWILPKGKGYQEEIKKCSFRCQIKEFPNEYSEGVILKIMGVEYE